MEPIVWAIMLVFLALGLGVLEMFIPSQGILAFLSLTAVGASVVVAFFQGPVFGLAFFIAVVIGLPILVWMSILWWPMTPIGRRILLDQLQPEDVMPDDHGFKALVGKRGVAQTKMMPSGAIQIDNRTYTAFSQSVAISPGDPVEVVKVEGSQIQVRLANGFPDAADSGAVSDGGDNSSDDDLLSQPIDSLGLDIDPIGD